MSGRALSFPIRVSVAIGPLVDVNSIEVDVRSAVEICYQNRCMRGLRNSLSMSGPTHRLPVRESVAIGPLLDVNSIEVDVRSALGIWDQY